VLRELKITPHDAIVDFGSGKGGALITFSRFPFSKISGVEISPELVATATENFRKLNLENITVTLCDASCFTDLDDYNYFYFFSPFPHGVMSDVIRNLCASLEKRPRKTTIIYFNPECHDAVVTNSPFVKSDEFHHHELMYYIYHNNR
jgi:methylase of polypeptide subunit release factors